ncbi:MAG: tyrosine--tRNA ligase, partial [Clostridia bacterium]|nr:tyrosine--tRNA ligase [Clostridia bacterium]
LYHGAEAVPAAAQRYASVALGGVPENVESVEFPVGVRVVEVLSRSGLAPSNSEARRLILGGGVKLDGNQVNDPNATLAEAGEYIISKGKNKFIKAVVK